MTFALWILKISIALDLRLFTSYSPPAAGLFSQQKYLPLDHKCARSKVFFMHIFFDLKVVT
jgi:hypothetical protein